MHSSSVLRPSGELKMKVFRGVQKPPLKWKVRQALRWDTIFGSASVKAAKTLSALTGIPVITSQLSAVATIGGMEIDYGVISRRVVTTAFVNFMVDQMQAETTEWGDFKYHDSGVGTTAAAVGDTDIETTDGESRATGSQAEGATANIYKTVGTIAYTTTKAITEQGVFSQVTGGTLIDRHVFAAINVNNGDSIQFTYEFTVSSGG